MWGLSHSLLSKNVGRFPTPGTGITQIWGVANNIWTNASAKSVPNCVVYDPQQVTPSMVRSLCMLLISNIIPTYYVTTFEIRAPWTRPASSVNHNHWHKHLAHVDLHTTVHTRAVLGESFTGVSQGMHPSYNLLHPEWKKDNHSAPNHLLCYKL